MLEKQYILFVIYLYLDSAEGVNHFSYRLSRNSYHHNSTPKFISTL